MSVIANFVEERLADNLTGRVDEKAYSWKFPRSAEATTHRHPLCFPETKIHPTEKYIDRSTAPLNHFQIWSHFHPIHPESEREKKKR